MGVSMGTGYRLKSSLDPSLKRSSDHIELYVQDVSDPEDVCGENDKLSLVKYFSKDEKYFQGMIVVGYSWRTMREHENLGLV